MSRFETSGVSLFKNTNMSDQIKHVNTVEIPVRRYQIRANTTVGFERANWQIACQNKKARANRYHKGQQVPFSVDLDHFKSYGPGIYLFFTFLKQITILFFIMTIVSFIPIIYNYLEGTNLSTVGDSLQVNFARLTIANQQGVSSELTPTETQIYNSLRDKLVNVIPDLFNAVLFFVFFLYWDRKSKRLTMEVKKSIKLTSQNTVEITNFPQDVTEKDIEEYMGRFGKLKEVAAVKDYQETIALSKKIFELSLEHKELRIQNQGNQSTQKMKKIEQKISKLYVELTEQQKEQKLQIIKFFVQFDSPLIRDQVVEAFKPHQDLFKCFRAKPDPKFYLKGMICNVQTCNEEPGGIIWENVHITWKSRWVRFLIQLVLLLVVIFAGFLMISFLNITTPPLSNDQLDTTSYNQITIRAVTDKGIVESWCLKNTATTTQTISLCQIYIFQYYYKTAIGVAITIAAVLIKFLMKIIVRALAFFQRYKTHTEQSSNLIMNLFVSYTVTTVVIIFLLQANVFKISFKSILSKFINSEYYTNNLNLLVQYNDFSAAWYMDIGYQILFTWIILALSPHTFFGIVHFLLQKIGQCRAKSQVLQKNMEAKMEAQQFDIEDHYSNILMILLVTMMFCGGIPLMIPLSFIGLFTRYLYLKHSFIRFCRVPKTFNEAINDKVLGVLPFCVFFNFAFTIWMYGVKEIFAFQQNWLSSLINTNSSYDVIKGLGIFLQRISTNWYIAIILVVVLFITIFKTIFFDLIGKCCSKQEPTGTKKMDDEEKIVERSERSLTNSYKLQNNPDYVEVLAIMNPKTARNM